MDLAFWFGQRLKFSKYTRSIISPLHAECSMVHEDCSPSPAGTFLLPDHTSGLAAPGRMLNAQANARSMSPAGSGRTHHSSSLRSNRPRTNNRTPQPRLEMWKGEVCMTSQSSAQYLSQHGPAHRLVHEPRFWSLQNLLRDSWRGIVRS